MEEYQKMLELQELLNTALAEFKTRGINYAKAYKSYRIALAQELLKLRDEGVPVTISYDIARGNDLVANYKEQEIITEALYKSSQEAINSYKLQIKILQEQINKEYNKGV